MRGLRVSGTSSASSLLAALYEVVFHAGGPVELRESGGQVLVSSPIRGDEVPEEFRGATVFVCVQPEQEQAKAFYAAGGHKMSAAARSKWNARLVKRWSTIRKAMQEV